MKRNSHQSTISSLFNQRSRKTSPEPDNSARSLEQVSETEHEISCLTTMNTEVLFEDMDVDISTSVNGHSSSVNTPVNAAAKSSSHVLQRQRTMN